jgi:hypothetical protein
MDDRLYLYSDADWEEYFAAADGRVSVDDLVAEHHPDAFVLHPYHQAGLVRRLREHPRWQELHADENGCVFVPR